MKAWFFHLFLRRQPAQGTILAGSYNLVLKEGRSYQLKIQLLHLMEFGYIAPLGPFNELLDPVSARVP